jgi:rhodanese-related sulfurtransferase
MSGGKTVAQMLSEAAAQVPFMSLAELRSRTQDAARDLLVLDVREREAYEQAHIPGAVLLPRGQLELRVNQDLPDPTRRILVYCELGRISTLATATLRTMGYQRASRSMVASRHGVRLDSRSRPDSSPSSHISTMSYCS